MSLGRRLEIFLGGPARPFPLTVREADTLRSGVDLLIEQFQTESLKDGGDALDVKIIEDMRALRRRLWIFAGYSPESVRGK